MKLWRKNSTRNHSHFFSIFTESLKAIYLNPAISIRSHNYPELEVFLCQLDMMVV